MFPLMIAEGVTGLRMCTLLTGHGCPFVSMPLPLLPVLLCERAEGSWVGSGQCAGEPRAGAASHGASLFTRLFRTGEGAVGACSLSYKQRLGAKILMFWFWQTAQTFFPVSQGGGTRNITFSSLSLALVRSRSRSLFLKAPSNMAACRVSSSLVSALLQ